MSRNNTSHERTEAERERAREERERRRLAKAGTTQTAPPLPPPAMPAEAQGPPPQPLPAMPTEAQEPPPQPLPAMPTEAQEPPPQPPPAVAPVAEQRTPTPSLANGVRLAHRPHLPRRASRVRKGTARAGALVALTVVLAVLGGAAVLLLRRGERPKAPPAPAVRVVKVVIPEGYTRAQIATLAHADGLRGSYLVASKSSPQVSLSHFKAPSGTPNLEGFLFPATYEMYAGAPASQLVSEQLAAFRENFGGAEVHRAKVLGITPYQLLIVASIIEREVAVPHDRVLVAAVIYNRLRLNMTLGVDSTLRYALHDFTHPLTESELKSSSPYNTRIHAGLPPTPISNPGVAAIKAASRPAKVSYLYYVAGSDGCGEQVFSTSYSEFEKNAAAYSEALRRNGGHVPSCKKK